MASHKPVAESLSAAFQHITDAAKRAVQGDPEGTSRQTRSSTSRAREELENRGGEADESFSSAADYGTATEEEVRDLLEDSLNDTRDETLQEVEGSGGSEDFEDVREEEREGEEASQGDRGEEPPGDPPAGDEPPGADPPGDDNPGPNRHPSGGSSSDSDMAGAPPERANEIAVPGNPGQAVHDFVARELARIDRFEQRLFGSMRELEALLDPDAGVTDEIPVAAANTTLASDRSDFKTEVTESIKRMEDEDNGVEREEAIRIIGQLEELTVNDVRAARQLEAAATKWLKDLRDAADRKGLKLLTPKLTQYVGSIIEWPTWSEQFEAQISSRKDLSSGDKYQFLVQHTGGEARKLIQRFRGNFDGAWRSLHGRFGQPTTIVEKTFEAMDSLKPKGYSVQDSRDLLDEFLVHVDTLKRLGHVFGDGIANTHPIRQMKSKMRQECVTQWNRWVSAQRWPPGRYPTIDEFVTFMDQELKDQANAQTKKPDKSGGGKGSGSGTALFQNQNKGGGKGTKPSSGRQQGKGWGGSPAQSSAKGGRKPKKSSSGGGAASAPAIPEWGPDQCAFCGQKVSNHRAVDCPAGKKLSAREKRKYLKHGCWRCLKLGHTKTTCKVPASVCGIGGCQMDHHKLLHEGFGGGGSPKKD